jgi:alpha,alpha-trehalase
VAAPPAENLDRHLETTWDLLRREPDAAVEGSSLLPLDHPYIIPGGRFRECYYWDTYFTMLGLRESGREALILAMADNLAGLIRRYGLIPNGNRTYYLTRSQPPVLALIVELIVERHGPEAYARYRSALEAELDFWNDRSIATSHRCVLADGAELYRYYDDEDRPRWESFAVDEEVAATTCGSRPGIYRDLRAATESGWDFSSRWFVDGTTICATRTTQFAPVDLNCYLVQLEHTLASACVVAGEAERAEAYRGSAERRIDTIRRYCWSEETGFFHDYHLPTQRRSPALTLATVAPLFLRIATPDQASRVIQRLKADFLKPGGLVTTLVTSGEQWDYPNGWAPLQWMAVRGLEAYGHRELAIEIARRWTMLNAAVFERSGRLLEKYNVVDLGGGGGGEYPTQVGFGWTNGVLLALQRYLRG